MGIEKIRSLSKKASEAGKLVKAVTAFKNELKDKEQMYDMAMSDHFKTLREPIIVGKCRFWDIDLGNFPKLGQFFF